MTVAGFLLLTGCSFVSGSSAVEPLALPLHELASSTVAGRVEVTPLDERLYRLRLGDRTEEAIVSAIRQCKVAQRPLRAHARQLLIGLGDLRIEDQREVPLPSGNAVISRAQGTLDERPIALVSLCAFTTVNSQPCTLDLVAWAPDPHALDDVEDTLLKLLPPLIENGGRHG